MAGNVSPQAEVNCAVIDGPVSESAPGARRIASRKIVGIDASKPEPAAPGRVEHALMCIDTMGEIEPLTRMHLVQIFERDGEDAPAERVLEGLARAVGLGAQVICLPLTIAETRHAADIESICEKAALAGTIIVAAWAPGVDRAIPASFKSVMGVQHARSQGAVRAVSWIEERRTAGTPMSASMGTAVIAGLAASYLRLTREANLRGFAASIKAFASCAAPTATIPERGGARISFDYSTLARGIGATYREYLAGTRAAS